MGNIEIPPYFLSWSATADRRFSVMKVLTPNIKEISLTAIRLAHSSMLEEKMQVADSVFNELLSSCSHASNRYRMYLMDKNTEKEIMKGRKRRHYKKNHCQQRREMRNLK